MARHRMTATVSCCCVRLTLENSIVSSSPVMDTKLARVTLSARRANQALILAIAASHLGTMLREFDGKTLSDTYMPTISSWSPSWTSLWLSSSSNIRAISKAYFRCWWRRIIPHSSRDRPRIAMSLWASSRHRAASSSSISASSERFKVLWLNSSFIEYSSPLIVILPKQQKQERKTVSACPPSS
jgi:hypothetical protein